jgi:hypothetical protein
MYKAELAKDPTSRAAQSSRSNMIALRHTIEQIYGEAAELRRPYLGSASRPSLREVTKVLLSSPPAV